MCMLYFTTYVLPLTCFMHVHAIFDINCSTIYMPYACACYVSLHVLYHRHTICICMFCFLTHVLPSYLVPSAFHPPSSSACLAYHIPFGLHPTSYLVRLALHIISRSVCITSTSLIVRRAFHQIYCSVCIASSILCVLPSTPFCLVSCAPPCHPHPTLLSVLRPAPHSVFFSCASPPLPPPCHPYHTPFFVQCSL